MAGYGEQLQAAKNAHLAATSLELLVRQEIANVFSAWENGEYTAQSVRWKLESIIRTAYRTSASVAAQHAARQSGIPGWEPSEVFTSDYLTDLIADIRRNLREYKASDQGEKARRRAVLRMQHGAGVAAQRGYTDSMIASYAELEDFGYRLRKVWLANFVNNDPCEHCRALHGVEVGLHEEFPLPTLRKLAVYGDLKGPPRHPRCRCYLAILVVSLENAFEDLDIETPTPSPETMTTDDVKKMPNKIWGAVVKTLRKIVSFVKGDRHG